MTRRLHGPRAAALLAATSLLLAGCSGEGGDPAGGDTVSILVVKHSLTKPMSEMGWVSQLEQKAGVRIEWEEVSADWDQKKSTILAAGDVPDLVVGANAITDSDVATFNGLFEDLRDHMDALPNVRDFLASSEAVEAVATQADGAVYSLPTSKRFWPRAITHQYINQRWLDALGLAVPTTWDELFEVLVAFKERDPNGNGQPDEIPWDWSPVGTEGFGYFQPSVLLGSLGLPISGGGGAGYFTEDGVVGNFLVDERYAEVVAFLHRAYAAGLVSRDVITQDYSAYQSVARGSGDTARVGFSWGWTRSDRFGPGVYQQYTAMAPLLARSGQAEPVTWSYDFENITGNHVTLSALSENKDAALRVVNAFYDPEISLQVLFGDIGPSIRKAGDKAYEVLPPADPALDPSTWKWTNSLADNGPVWIREDLDVTLPTDLAEANEETVPLQPALDNVDPVLDVHPALEIKMSAEDLRTIALNDTTVLNLALTKFAEWVTAGGVREQWAGYVDQLNSAGLRQNVEIHQRYYDQWRARQG